MPTEELVNSAFYAWLLAHPDWFGFEDVTGLPWIEIDFPEDVVRARDEVLPAIQKEFPGY